MVRGGADAAHVMVRGRADESSTMTLRGAALSHMVRGGAGADAAQFHTSSHDVRGGWCCAVHKITCGACFERFTCHGEGRG